MKSIYKTPEGKRLILECYDRLFNKLNVKFESRYINTRFGKTHLLIGGQKTAEPLVIFHGGQILNPVELKTFEELAKNYRIYAPDTIGQPGNSDETKLSSKNDDLGKWVVDLLDELDIKKAAFIATSVGGGILMKLSAYAPERISKAVFIVPMGLGYGSYIKMFFKIVIPMFLYSRSPSKEKLIHAIEAMYYNKDEICEDMLLNFEYILQHTYLIPNAIRPPSKKELIKFTAPAMLIAAENDILHPAKTIVHKAKKNISNLIKIKIIKKSGHVINEINMQEILKDIIKFLGN
jgi:pimeloyl-ACP methyl ester carboxylesterase